MSASMLVVISIVALVIGYIIYGRYLSRIYDLDPKRQTPAHAKKDGVDYVPTRAPILMGHHFASIAGAHPSSGRLLLPFLAGYRDDLDFIWQHLYGRRARYVGPGSFRQARGKTMGEVIEDHIGRSGKRLFLVFAWSLVTLVIAVFAHAVANVFVKEPSTATASSLFIIVAIVFGMSVYPLNAPLWLSSIVGIALLAGCIAIGLRFPLVISSDAVRADLGTLGPQVAMHTVLRRDQAG